MLRMLSDTSRSMIMDVRQAGVQQATYTPQMYLHSRRPSRPLLHFHSFGPNFLIEMLRSTSDRSLCDQLQSDTHCNGKRKEFFQNTTRIMIGTAYINND